MEVAAGTAPARLRHVASPRRARGARRGCRTRERRERLRRTAAAEPNGEAVRGGPGAWAGPQATDPPARRRVVVVEVDGALIDVQGELHRRAFNAAFMRLGCGVQWHDPEAFGMLVRAGGGSAEGMVERYFMYYGFPSSTGGNLQNAQARTWEGKLEETKEARDAFIESVVAEKDRAVMDLVEETVRGKPAFDLRPGAREVVADCLATEGVQVVLLAATGSEPSDRIVDAALALLGPELAGRCVVVEAAHGADPMGVGDLDFSLAAALTERKGELMRPEVKDLQRQDYKSDMIVDSGMFNMTRRATSAMLLDVAGAAGVAPASVVVLGASQASCDAAHAAGMRTAIARTRMQEAAEFSRLDTHGDGFGFGGGVTAARLLHVLGYE